MCSLGAAPLLTSYHVCCLFIMRCLSLLCTCGLGLCSFSELVCDLLPRRIFMLRQRLIAEDYLSYNLDKHCLENTRTSAFPTPVGGHHSLGATFLGT